MAFISFADCIPLSETQCAMVIRQSELLDIAKDPAALKTASTSERSLQELSGPDKLARDLHNNVNRAVQHGKKKNIPHYARYLEAIRGAAGKRKKSGLAPPILLYHRDKLKYVTGGDGPVEFGKPCQVQIPRGATFVAIDGDSQLAARHLLQKQVVESADDYLIVPLVHGESESFARRAFCDMNLYGVKVQKTLALELNDSDPLALVAKALRDHYGECENKRGIPSLAAFQSAAKAYLGGFARAKEKEEFSDEEITGAEGELFDWFNAVFDLLRTRYGTKPWGIAASQTLLVAIGDLGHRVRDDDHDIAFQAALASLAAVDWNIGDHWVGIAAKRSTRKVDYGQIVADCTWSTWQNATQAICNASSPFYHRIRHLSERVAV